MTLTHEDVRKILAILDESDYEEVHIEFRDLKLDLRRRRDSSDIQHVPRHGKPEDRAVSPQTPKIVATETTTSAAPAPPKTSREEALPDGVAAVIAHPDFRDSRVTTQWVEQEFCPEVYRADPTILENQGAI